MKVNLSEQEIDIIIVALKGFVDDNNLYAEQISARLSSDDVNKLEQLNSKAELLVVKLDNLLDEVEEHDVKTAIKQFYKNI